MNRVQIQIIKEAIDQPENLSDWEADFIDGIACKDSDYELSEKQNAVLNRIGSKMD